MNSNDEKRFSELMSMLALNDDSNMTPERYKLFFFVLKEFSITEIKQAVGVYLKSPEARFKAKPANIASLISEQRTGGRTLEDRASIAWMVAERAIGSVGAYGALKMDDKQALTAIKAMGSWQQLCHTDRDKLAWKQKEFIANYKALEHTAIESLPECLLGIEDLTNQRLGVDNETDKQMNSLMGQLENRKNGE